MKKGKGVGEGTGREGERRGNREKGGGRKWGPKAQSKNSDFGPFMI